MKDGSMITSVAPNRAMAVKFVVQQRFEGKDDNIAYVKVQGQKATRKYPFGKPLHFDSNKFEYISPHHKGKILLGPKDEFAPPLPEPKTEQSVEEQETKEMLKENNEALAQQQCAGTGFFTSPDLRNVHMSMTGSSGSGTMQVDMTGHPSDEVIDLKDVLEFLQKKIGEDMQDIMSSNEHLRQENEKLREKMKEGMTMTILPGGHAIIIYGGRVLELSDLPPAPPGA